MIATGPQALPVVVAILSPFGLIFEKEKPTPPPFFLRIEDSLTTSNISSILSSNGKTKQLASCPLTVPALASVLPPGRNSRLAIISKNFFFQIFLSFSFSSAEATAPAIRSSQVLVLSTISPLSFFLRYLFFMITREL